MKKSGFKDYLPISLMIFIFLIDLSLIFTTHKSWNNSMERILPLKSQIQNLKSDITTAHLWFEEAIGGDKTINIENDVMSKLKNKILKEYLEINKNKELEEDKLYIFNSLKQIDTKMDEFLILAYDRWNDITLGKIGSSLDQNFDNKFKALIFILDELNYFMDEQLNNEFKRKENSFILIISLFLFVNIVVLFLLYRYKKQKLSFEEELIKNEKLLIQQAKMAAMGEMLENIAHQWRQPLSLVSTASTGLKLKVELNDFNKNEIIETLGKINESSQYLSKTIDDFRNFFEPQKNKTTFDIKKLYEQSISLLSLKLKEENISFIANIKSYNLSTYESQLLQVFMNIFTNAIDAFEENKIKNKMVFVDIYEEKDFIYINILDNAKGIKEEALLRVFEPYYTSKHKSKGTGIGLYMVKQIIEKHMKGEIFVENKDFIFDNVHYRGAFFQIKLPYTC